MINKVDKFLKRYGVWIVLAISILLAVLATLHYYHDHEILAYNDARSRLDIARRVTDSKTPGIVQIGTVWLPLQQFLMVPFVANSFLWHTGLGGSIVSMAAYVVASLFIFKTILLITKRGLVSLFGTLLFMLNINVLYMQTTAMTEVLLLATMAGGIYYFMKWLKQRADFDLVMSALWISVGTLVRYEAWILLAICAAIVFIENRSFMHNKKKAEGQSILFITLGFLGIALWLLWNLLFFGSPLYFLTGQQGQYSLSGHASTNRHNIVQTLDTIWRTIGYNVGFVTLIFTAIILIFLLAKRTKNHRFTIYLIALLLAPIITNIITLFLGTTGINAQSLAQAFDVRYGIGAVVLVAIIVPLAIDKLPKLTKPFAMIGGLLLLLTVPSSSYLSAVNGGRSIAPQEGDVIQAFSVNYNGGNILASTYAFDPAMHYLQIPLKDYIYEGNYKIWQATLLNPQTNVKYILMDTNVSHDPVYDAYNNKRSLYDKYYTLTYYKNGYRVMQLRSTLSQDQVTPLAYAPKSATNRGVIKQAAKPLDAVAVTIQPGDSQTSIIQSEILKLDPSHSLSPVEVTYVEATMVQSLGANNLIYPGNTLTINLDTLRQLIEQSKTLTSSQVSSLQPFANNITYP